MTTTYTWTEINDALTAGIEMTAEAAEQPCTDPVFVNVRSAVQARLSRAVQSSNGTPTSPTLLSGEDVFTAEEVSRVVNEAVDNDASSRGRCANDRDNLLVNAVLTVLKEPEADFEDVASSCYGEAPATIARWARNAA